MSWLMVAGWWGKMRAKANRKKSTFVFTIPPSLTNNTQLSSPQIRHIFLETGFKLHLSHLAWTKALVPVSLIFPLFLSLYPALLIAVKLSRSDRGQPSIIVATRLHPHSINIAEHWSVVSDQPWYYPTTIQFLHFYYSNNLRSDDLSHQDVGGIF